jgi:RNA-binding protein
MELTGKQKRYLRGIAHSLNPVVGVGKEGQSDAVIRKTRIELDNHELIKVKVGDGCLEPAKDIGAWLAEACGAAVVQVIGHTVILYKRRKKEPSIVLPKADAPVVVVTAE